MKGLAGSLRRNEDVRSSRSVICEGYEYRLLANRIPDYVRDDCG